jgi:hypothetical protein
MDRIDKVFYINLDSRVDRLAEIESCYDKLQEIDDYLVRKEFRLQFLGEKHADKYE